jgi:hypothetical protein
MICAGSLPFAELHNLDWDKPRWYNAAQKGAEAP